MIEVRNLRKSFDGFVALDDLNMTVPDGAVYGPRQRDRHG